MGSDPICLVFLKDEIRTQTHREERPCEDTGGSQPSTGERERPQENLTLLIPRP